MQLFPYSEAHLLTPLDWVAIETHLDLKGRYRLIKRGENYFVLGDAVPWFFEAGPHIWVYKVTSGQTGTRLKIKQKTPQPRKIFSMLACLFFIFVLYINTSTIKEIFVILAFLFIFYLLYGVPFFTSGRKNLEFLKALLNAEQVNG